ncbi:MAG TPA: tetratricopeptide repeat protein [Vicinamibacterales bacterium]|nr:tetratricopeptide repeat protein [Vicinamibacterales bacterium]
MNPLAIACAALLLNSAWLWAFADASPWYYANVALHPVLGIALAIALLGRARRFAGASPLRAATAASLATAAVTGVAILVLGATRPYYALVIAHVAVSVAGPILLVLALRPRFTLDAATAGAAALFVIVAGAAILHATRDDARRERFAIANPDVVPASMDEESRGPSSPFYPSSADTNVKSTIPANFFLTSDTCGRCHTDIYEQWRSSMHHFSSFNNQWYRKSIEYMQDTVGTRPSKWCAGCHDHAVFFNGRFDRPIREQISTAEAQAGLACTSCHSITRVHGTMGQGGFEIEYPPLHDLAASDNPILRRLHDTLTNLAPRPHRETFLKPFHREQTSQFCSACHKVHLDEPVNAYRWLRGFNEYDNWQGSGVSGEGARSFYYPPAPQGCADCHMPLVVSRDPAARDGRVHSHRFAAANTAVPFVNHDTAQLEAVKAFLQDGQVTLDLFGLARGAAAPSTSLGARSERARADEEPTAASTFALGEESAAFGAARAMVAPAAPTVTPFADGVAAVRRGESVRLEVVARTRKVGHFFPGGTVDAFDVWVDVEAVDDRGRVLLRSGALEHGTGAVDPAAHFYRSLQLDGHGNRINKRNAWATRSLAYVRLIPPGAADTIHYRLDIPAEAGDTITVTARLRYRKFSWWNTQWAYAGIRDPSEAIAPRDAAYDDGGWVFSGDTSNVSGATKAIPQIPVIDMATATATIKVVGPRVALPMPVAPPAPRTRERWNDYGIGLLLQGDIRGAEAAFTKVTEIEPAYADGWVNIARARIQEGDMQGADAVLRQALAIDPALAKTHVFLGTALKSLGRYDEALTHLRRAAEAYPRDRVVMNQAGRVLFLQGRLREAASEFRKVLAIDPEDLQAHYNLMLCYQGLGDEAARTREQRLYERLKADEASQAITGGYRLLNPDDNNERQQIHEHGQ